MRRYTPSEHAALELGFDASKINNVLPAELADFVVQKFAVETPEKEPGAGLEETEAVLALCDIILDVPFDDSETGRKTRARACGLLTELIGTHMREELTDEDVRLVQMMLNADGKTVDEVREHFRVY